MRRRSSALALALTLAACGPPAGQEPSVKAEVEDIGNGAGSGGAALEAAALEAGAIPNAPGESPVGLFQRVHEGGTDSLCIVPAEGARQRFGLEVRFGEKQGCKGRGEVKSANDALILSFDRSNCVVVANYDGDHLIFPGAVDRACQALCSARGSLAGVELPRVSSEEGAAGAIRDLAGDPLCPDA